MLDGEDGSGGRKLVQRWAAIVAESSGEGATVAGVAARYGIRLSQLSAWRSAARKTGRKRRETYQPLGFAEIAVMHEPVPSVYDGIEIRAGSVVIRLPKGTPAKRAVEIALGVSQP